MEIDKIICGDCVEIMKGVGNESVDFVITSPPYDGIRDYKNFDGIDLTEIGKQVFRILKDGGMCAVVLQDETKNFGKSLTTFRTAVTWCDEIGFKLFETVIYSRWGRPGAWWSKRFRVDHEYILLFLKGKRPKYFDKSHLSVPAKHAGETWHGTQRLTNGELIKIKATKQKDTKGRGTIWHYKTSNTEGNKTKMLHPATFPDKLAEDLILCFTKENDLVLDPMCGSGTSCCMARKNNRHYIGIDISPEYCEIAKTRIGGKYVRHK